MSDGGELEAGRFPKSRSVAEAVASSIFLAETAVEEDDKEDEGGVSLECKEDEAAMDCLP